MSVPHTLVVVAIALGSGLAVHLVVMLVVAPRLARSRFWRAVVARTRRPLALLMPVLAAELALGTVGRNDTLSRALGHGADILLVASLAWLAIEGSYVADDLLAQHYSLDPTDNLRARRVRTQIQLLRRVAAVLVIVIAAAVVLLSFGRVRALGASLLASAGLAGLVAGTAARPALSSIISGLQLAITQPIRLDDVVVINDQWGRVEEIALTYVVLRLWDLRRLVLPISTFLTSPFENWTRQRADIIGTVLLHVDYATPVDELRGHLQELAAGSHLWDGRTCVLQVVDAGPRTMTLRALLSSGSASASWDLCCAVRESLISWLADRHPECLPHVRTSASRETVALLTAEAAGAEAAETAGAGMSGG